MSNHSRGVAAARIASVTTRERTFALPEAAEDYLANSPSLAAEALVADHTHVLPDYRTATAEPHPRHTRAAWLLVVWLVVSGATIAVAASVITKYF